MRLFSGKSLMINDHIDGTNYAETSAQYQILLHHHELIQQTNKRINPIHKHGAAAN